ncbi:MAG: hypothetical protein HQL13_05935 [Candidatus Omnitrophica bacterium]|nr:hypothetical protein [Candidatus Omnitrophota bacterium]
MPQLNTVKAMVEGNAVYDNTVNINLGDGTLMGDIAGHKAKGEKSSLYCVGLTRFTSILAQGSGMRAYPARGYQFDQGRLMPHEATIVLDPKGETYVLEPSVPVKHAWRSEDNLVALRHFQIGSLIVSGLVLIGGLFGACGIYLRNWWDRLHHRTDKSLKPVKVIEPLISINVFHEGANEGSNEGARPQNGDRALEKQGPVPILGPVPLFPDFRTGTP